VVGALTGGIFSVVGLGLGGLGKKIAGRFQGAAGVRMQEIGAVQKALKADAKSLGEVADDGLRGAIQSAQVAKAQREAAKLAGNPLVAKAADEALEAAETAVARNAERLGFPGGRGGQSGAQLHELGERITAAKAAMGAAQAEAFGLGGLGQAIARVGGPGGLLGGGLGFGAGGLLGGGVGWLVGQAALPWAGRQLAKMLSNKTATRAIGSMLEGAGKTIRAGAITGLTRDDARDVRERLTDVEPVEVKQAALEAYQAEGVEPGTSEMLADFQARRVAAMKRGALEARTPEALGRTLEAIRDPRGVLHGIARDELSPEAWKALQRMSPGLARQFREAARMALEEDDEERKLSRQRRATLKRMAQSPDGAEFVLMMQRLHQAQRAAEEAQNKTIRGRGGMLPHGNQLKAEAAVSGAPGMRR
jgi:hypothetical protein